MTEDPVIREERSMPKATVAAVILESGDEEPKILLTRRNIEPFKDAWCLPGGHIEPYEAAAAAVVREVQEETGLQFTGQPMGSFDEIYPELGVHNVVQVFVGRGEGELRPCETEVSDIGWFPLSEAMTIPLAFCHGEVLQSLPQPLP